MTTVTNSFEGGTNSTAISTGNSGGLSGTAFNSVSNVTFSTAQKAHGLLSARMPPSSTSSATMLYDDLSGSGNRWIRAYLYSTSWSGSPTVAYLSTVAFSLFYVVLTATQVQIVHNNGTSDSTIATISVAPATSAWIRVEMQANNSTGAAEIRLYNSPDSSTPSGTATGSRTTPASTWFEASWLNFNAGAEMYFDDVGWSDVDWLGSAVASPLRPRILFGSTVAVHRSASI